MAKKKPGDYGTGVPLPEIQKFFESAEGQKEFREWKERQQK